MIIDGKEVAVSEEERIVEALIKDLYEIDSELLNKKHCGLSLKYLIASEVKVRWIKIVRKVFDTH